MRSRLAATPWRWNGGGLPRAELAGYRMAALFGVSDNTLQNKSLMGGRTDAERAWRKQVRATVFPRILYACFAENGQS